MSFDILPGYSATPYVLWSPILLSTFKLLDVTSTCGGYISTGYEHTFSGPVRGGDYTAYKIYR